MFDVKEMGKKIRELRNKRSQDEVAQALGISRGALSFYENGERKPDADVIFRMCEYFGVTSDFLLGLSNVKSNDIELQGVCDYLNISENAIKTYNEVVIEVDKNNHKFFKQKRHDVVSKLFESHIFYELIEQLREMFDTSDCLTFLLYNIPDYELTDLCQRLNIDYQALLDDIDNAIELFCFLDYEKIDITRYKIFKLVEKISDIFDMRSQIENYSREELIEKLCSEISLSNETIKPPTGE